VQKRTDRQATFESHHLKRDRQSVFAFGSTSDVALNKSISAETDRLVGD
jgi:hypothetical protein